MIAQEKWLGCRHDVSPMFDIPGSTPVWAPCILFFGSQDIKTYVYIYIYILFSKSIYSIKEHWWFFVLSWPDEIQRMFSTVHELLNVKLKPQTIYDDFIQKL